MADDSLTTATTDHELDQIDHWIAEGFPVYPGKVRRLIDDVRQLRQTVAALRGERAYAASSTVHDMISAYEAIGLDPRCLVDD